MSNRLANETSPYLLQHQENPVDWYPWGEEALAAARESDRPILLSVGYAACHWCHVMAHESFEDPATAAVMNEHFINIKVDREERPDIDTIYMEAVQTLTGHGGWPMTVFLTPEGVPFYGGTYFPPTARHGLPAFVDLLRGVADAYQNKRQDVAHNAVQLRERLRIGFQANANTADSPPLTVAVLDEATERLAATFDPNHGGFGGAPKFPQGMTLDFLLRQYARTGSDRALQMAEITLEKMARGGIYDQLGGGFHRYSVDERWLVPHFEKMLYDNAILAPIYLHAYQLTNKDLYRRIAVETLDWASREMTDGLGGFYSSLDADSDGAEGKYYVWPYAELVAMLGAEDAYLVGEYFGCSERGNFEGANILHLPRTIDLVAHRTGADIERLGEALDRARTILTDARNERIYPGRDEKVLTAWNGLMIRAFAEAATVLERDDYRYRAELAADFALQYLYVDRRLRRTYKDGQARLNGYLEDYAFLADGLLALYETTFAPQWLDAAYTLTQEMLDLFWDDAINACYDTGRDHEQLVARPRSLTDNALPSGNAVAADVLLRLAALYGRSDWYDKALAILTGVRELLRQYPTAAGRYLCALDFALAAPQEVAIVGDLRQADTQALLHTFRERFRPNTVIAVRQPASQYQAEPNLLHQRTQRNNTATAYVCQHHACQQPVTTPAEFAVQLGD